MKLSVGLVTYNQENYVEKTIRSILSQKTTFPFDIVVADDFSNDKTLKIINNYEKTTNIPFIYLKSSKNLGITRNYQRLFNICTSTYLAPIEGDDIWSDPYRLQKHVDFLDNHAECSMSFNRLIVVNYEKAEFSFNPSWCNNAFQYITSRDLARENLIGNFSACIYRKEILDSLPAQLFELTAYDWIINIMVGMHGLIAYLGDTMSIYRQHSSGTWSSMDRQKQLQEIISNIKEYNKITDNLFENEFTDFISKHSFYQLQNHQLLGNKKLTRAKLKRLTPPILISIIKLITPPILYEKLIK